jgi:AraC-like DNA-binding protein
MSIFYDTDYHYEIGLTYSGEVPSDFRKQQNHTGLSYLSWYLRKGSGEVKTATETLRIQPGDWVFMDPLTTRSHSFSGDVELVSIRFRLHWRGLNFIPPRLAPRIYRSSNNSELLRSAEALSAFEAEIGLGMPMPPSQQCLRSLCFSDWLYRWHLTREEMGGVTPVPMDPRVTEIMSRIGQTPGVGLVDYEQLRQVVGLSKAQINRIFKAATGLTPVQWSEVHIMKAAEDSLYSEQLSIKEIAAKLNFHDASHFIKWFRKHAGCTPKTWRTRRGRNLV